MPLPVKLIGKIFVLYCRENSKGFVLCNFSHNSLCKFHSKFKYTETKCGIFFLEMKSSKILQKLCTIRLNSMY